jgi:hypothetical protein
MVQARRRRGPGSLSQLKGYLWVCITYELSVIEDPTQSHDTRHKAVNGLTQAAMVYSRLVEAGDHEERLARLEAERNGQLVP